jgi:hypothetical protein
MEQSPASIPTVHGGHSMSGNESRKQFLSPWVPLTLSLSKGSGMKTRMLRQAGQCSDRHGCWKCRRCTEHAPAIQDRHFLHRESDARPSRMQARWRSVEQSMLCLNTPPHTCRSAQHERGDMNTSCRSTSHVRGETPDTDLFSYSLTMTMQRQIELSLFSIYGIPMMCMWPMRDPDHMTYAPVSL